MNEFVNHCPFYFTVISVSYLYHCFNSRLNVIQLQLRIMHWHCVWQCHIMTAFRDSGIIVIYHWRTFCIQSALLWKN